MTVIQSSSPMQVHDVTKVRDCLIERSMQMRHPSFQALADRAHNISLTRPTALVQLLEIVSGKTGEKPARIITVEADHRSRRILR